ncbi:Hypothetical predicted protein [Mytilus galloprovincialis]|uniref:DZIP3-like HEPN domain-containing protein n=1 Tax=Mytilus galloprovincialis TaxID=29158 RepID=A0A8B6FIP6_MYTGA|nr:Hypothetical predicted protein [Mytilus galloprovincialis]
MTSNERHARLGQMVLRLFPKVMQMVLKDNIKPAALKNKYKKRALNTNLHDSEVTLMKNLPNIEDFTIQLCYKILRYEDLLDKPKREWGQTPHDSDTEISDDIQRLLSTTNELLNKNSGDITYDYFKGFIDRIKQLIERIDVVIESDNCGKLFNSLYTEEINSSDYLQELLRMTPIEMTTNTPIRILNIKAREHFSRVSMVITGIFPNILRAVIQTIISANQLYQQHCLPNLNTAFQAHEQKSLKNLNQANNYDSVDIPLIYKLLRTFTLIVTPTKGWGQKPDAIHVTISDDVERIRILRNEIAHLSSTRIDRPAFEDYFSQFCDIGHRVDLYFISTTSYKQDILESITCVMDSDQHIRLEDALKRIDNITFRFESKPIRFYWGDTFETNRRLLQSMLKKEKSEGKKILKLEIVLQTEEEIDEASKILELNEIKDEINKGLTNITFDYAYKHCIVLCVELEMELFETKKKLLSNLVLFMDKILKNGNFEFCGTESIDAVLVFTKDTETTEAGKRSTAMKGYTDTKTVENRSTASSFYLTFEAESVIFETDERMQKELGETVKQVLKHGNGNGREHSITATLFPFNIDLFGLVETFLKPDINNEQCKVPGYKIFRKDRQCKDGGGLLVYVKDSIAVKNRSDLSINTLETLWLESGFRQGHSCQTALTKLIDEWLKYLDNGEIVGTVFLDFRKNNNKHIHPLYLQSGHIPPRGNVALENYSIDTKLDISKLEFKQFRDNLSKLERKALIELKHNDNIYISKADKNHTTVIVNKIDYIKVGTSHLNSNHYLKINEPTTNVVVKSIKDIAENLYRKKETDSQTS